MYEIISLVRIFNRVYLDINKFSYLCSHLMYFVSTCMKTKIAKKKKKFLVRHFPHFTDFFKYSRGYARGNFQKLFDFGHTHTHVGARAHA